MIFIVKIHGRGCFLGELGHACACDVHYAPQTGRGFHGRAKKNAAIRTGYKLRGFLAKTISVKSARPVANNNLAIRIACIDGPRTLTKGAAASAYCDLVRVLLGFENNMYVTTMATTFVSAHVSLRLSQGHKTSRSLIAAAGGSSHTTHAGKTWECHMHEGRVYVTGRNNRSCAFAIEPRKSRSNTQRPCSAWDAGTGP